MNQFISSIHYTFLTLILGYACLYKENQHEYHSFVFLFNLGVSNMTYRMCTSYIRRTCCYWVHIALEMFAQICTVLSAASCMLCFGAG